ncbi:MAG: hypothetical protein FJY67_05350 [Calditrichaeota bacterium]|nr:hypothetical protein [Calditrichota bacterium]
MHSVPPVLILVAAAASLFTSCSTVREDRIEPFDSTPTSPQQSQLGKTHQRIDGWTEWGIIHNACMDLLDDSLVNRPPSSFENQKAATDWVANLVADHLINEYEFDTSLVNPIRREMIEYGRRVTTRESFQDHVSEALLEEWISSQEYDYLMRLSNILYNSSWSEVQVSDSLESFKDDVVGISWSSNESTILPVMSIAYYSWQWRNIGFDDSDPGKLFGIPWGDVFISDCHAALATGACTGNPATGVAGGATWSAVEAICWAILD